VALSTARIVVAGDADVGKPAADIMNERDFHAFYHRTAGPLRGYAARVLGSVTDADDILQDAYLRFLRKPPPTDDPDQMRAYLFRIASNLMADRWRKRRRERPEESAPTPVSPQADVALGIDMARVFEQLKPQQRQMMWMAYVEGADHREIAAALSLGERSVRVLLSRARRKLAGLLRLGGHGER